MIKRLQIRDTGDWCKLTSSIVKQQGGRGLLNQYPGGLGKLLSTLSPSYHKTCRALVLDLMKDLKLQKVEDLLHVPVQYPSIT